MSQTARDSFDFNNDPDLSRVSVGDFCYAYTRRNQRGEYNSGHITHINSDRTLSVQFDDGKFKGKVMPKILLYLIEAHIFQERKYRRRIFWGNWCPQNATLYSTSSDIAVLLVCDII